MGAIPKGKTLFFLFLFVAFACISGLVGWRLLERNDEKSTLAVHSPQPPGVRCIQTKRAQIHSVIFGIGTARAVRREFLTFENPGKVTYVKMDKDGKPIREGSHVRGPQPGQRFGELLASVDQRQHVEDLKVAEYALVEAKQNLEVARAQIAQAEAQQKLADENFKRKETLYRVQAIPQFELDVARTNRTTTDKELQSARARFQAALSTIAAAEARINQARLPLERSSIYAPFDGILTYMNIKQGDFFAANLVDVSSEESLLRTIPMVLIDPSAFEVTLEAPYFEGILFKPGQPALISTTPEFTPTPAQLQGIEPLKEDGIRGFVHSVNPSVSPDGRSIQVKIQTEKAAQRIRDGMPVICWTIIDQKSAAIVVPFDVFIYRQNKSYVFRVDPIEKKAEQIEVIEGISGLFSQEILKGVQEGDLLVTDGRHRLSHGIPVTIIEIVENTRDETHPTGRQ